MFGKFIAALLAALILAAFGTIIIGLLIILTRWVIARLGIAVFFLLFSLLTALCFVMAVSEE